MIILLSSKHTVPFTRDRPGDLFAVATSVPVPASRSQTQILPLSPRLTHLPSARASADTGPVWPCSVRTNVNFGAGEDTDVVAVGKAIRYSCRPTGECKEDENTPLDDEYMSEVGEGEEDEEEDDEGDEGDGGEYEDERVGEGVGSPGAITSHLPSVCVSATFASLRFHCSRITRSLFSSIHPGGTLRARMVRVAVTVSESTEGVSKCCEKLDSEGVGDVGDDAETECPEIKSSVAPTDQCAG